MAAGVRGKWGRAAVVAAVVAACATPSAAANVWPRLTQVWTKGAATGPEIAIIAFLLLAAVIMASVAFAMRNADSLLFWLTCFAAGLFFAGVSYWMATEAATSWRNALASPAAVMQLKAAALDQRITAATTAAEKLPQLPHTTAAMVTAAKEAVTLATQSRDRECADKVGENCRNRVRELTTATTSLTTAEANRANTVERERLDAEIKAARQEKVDLGVIPPDVDPTAANTGKLLARFMDMGPRPDLVVMEWIPRVMAAGIELVGLVGPRIILTAMGMLEPRPSRLRTIMDFVHCMLAARRRRRQVETDMSARANSVDMMPAAVVVAAPARTAPPRQKSSKIKPVAVGDAASVRQWFKSRTVARAGSKLKPMADAYQGSYVPWCEEQGITPVSFTTFGTIIKAPVSEGGCGVVLERTPSKRDFYVGIALVGVPKLVAGGGVARLGPMARPAANPA